MTTIIRSMIARPPIRKPRNSSPKTSYTAGQLAKRYGFFAPPATQTQWVAVISLGGGSSLADVQAYCQQYGLPVPPVEFVSVQGATNDYTGNGQSADGENALDIQNILGATGGRVGIRVYTAPNSDSGFSAAIAQVASDNVCCACTISWGQAENGWQQSGIDSMNAAIQACVVKGIPVFAASGDDGSADGSNGNNVDFPASSPYTIGMGGTSLTASGEVAWNYGGGGVSALFPRPAFQASVTSGLGANRLVPDCALDADPNSGYPIVLNGVWDTFGGTSSCGPMMAAGVALVVSATGKRVDPAALRAAIYGGTMSDITQGSNTSIAGNIKPKFKAGVGFDLCTGNGAPNTAFWSAVAGNVTSPPPIIPPPTSPPPVSPPVNGPTAAETTAIVDAHCARPPWPLGYFPGAMHSLNGGIDADITKLFSSSQGVLMSSPQDFQSIVTEVEAILKAFGPWGKPIALALVNALVTDPSLKAILIGIISALPSPAISPQAQPASMSAAALSEQQQYVSAMTTVTFP